MPELLSDPTPTFLIVLGIITLIAVGVWWSQRSRRSLIGIALSVGILGLFLLCDQLFESKREQGNEHIRAMAEAATKGDGDAFVTHLSDSFTITKGGAGTVGKEQVRTSPAWNVVKKYNAEIDVWNLNKENYKELNDNEFELGFMAKASGAGEAAGRMFYVRAFFIKDPDGQYRVKTMKFYDPLTGGTKSEVMIPQFP